MKGTSAGGTVPPQLKTPPSWEGDTFDSGSDRDTVVLWHGCLAKHAKSIKANGIDFSKCSPNSDFGRGFYCTTLQQQAHSWADWKWRELSPTDRKRVENSLTLIQYKVARRALSQLLALHLFVRHERDYDDFWSFVWHFRNPQSSRPSHHCTGSEAPTSANWYDVVTGPVTVYWNQLLATNAYDQISVHTDSAKAVFDSSLHDIIAVAPQDRKGPTP